METYAAVRRFVIVEGNSQREASRVFGISRTTVYKMCTYSAPPGYQRTKPSAKPKLDQFIAIIYEILKADAGAPKKQRQSGLGVKSRTADCEAEVEETRRRANIIRVWHRRKDPLPDVQIGKALSDLFDQAGLHFDGEGNDNSWSASTGGRSCRPH